MDRWDETDYSIASLTTEMVSKILKNEDVISSHPLLARYKPDPYK